MFCSSVANQGKPSRRSHVTVTYGHPIIYAILHQYAVNPFKCCQGHIVLLIGQSLIFTLSILTGQGYNKAR